jgi:hypothetical protein
VPHESFWVTVGTAAPVIALAAIVASADMRGTANDFVEHWVSNLQHAPSGASKDKFRQGVERELYRGFLSYRWAVRATTVNIVLQAATLSLALGSLAVGRDLVPLLIPLVMADLGIVLLVVSSRLILRLTDFLWRSKPATVGEWFNVQASTEAADP